MEYRFYEDLYYDELKIEEKTNECKHTYRVIVDGSYCCSECGDCDLNDVEMVHDFSENNYFLHKSVYSRIHYFKEKLNNVCCLKMCFKKKYLQAKEIFKNEKIESIIVLKQLLNKHKMNKLYPHIYQLYKDLTGIQIIYLSAQQREMIIDSFKTLLTRFKTEKMFKKNLSGYDTLLYLLLKYHNIDGCEKLFHSKNIKKYDKFFVSKL